VKTFGRFVAAPASVFQLFSFFSSLVTGHWSLVTSESAFGISAFQFSAFSLNFSTPQLLNNSTALGV
jgi:hypothetical protein